MQSQIGGACRFLCASHADSDTPGIDLRRAACRPPPTGLPPAELALRLNMRRTNSSSELIPNTCDDITAQPGLSTSRSAPILQCGLHSPYTPPRQFKPAWAHDTSLALSTAQLIGGSNGGELSPQRAISPRPGTIFHMQGDYPIVRPSLSNQVQSSSLASSIGPEHNLQTETARVSSLPKPHHRRCCYWCWPFRRDVRLHERSFTSTRGAGSDARGKRSYAVSKWMPSFTSQSASRAVRMHLKEEAPEQTQAIGKERVAECDLKV